MKFLIVIVALIAVASAAPQQRWGEPEQQSVDPGDIVNFVVNSIASQRGTGRRQQGGGGEGDLIRILIRLVAAEFGLLNLDGRADGVDAEIVIRNLIKVFTNVVGNALLS